MKLQQGDVLLNKVGKIEGEETELNHLILAEGEVTGHCHKIVQGMAKLVMIRNIMYLKVLSDYAKLWHDEHREINIPEGIYEVRKVVEYDHFLEEARKVKD